MNELHLPTLITAHAWVIVALTILVGALYRVTQFTGSKYWFFSDLSGLLSIWAFSTILANGSRISFFLFALSTSLSIYLRVLAVCNESFAKSFRRLGIIPLGLLVLINIGIGEDRLLFRIALNSLIFAGFSACFVYALIWAHEFRGKMGRLMVLAAAVTYFSVALVRTFYALNADAIDIFVASPINIFSSTMLMLVGVLANIGYVIMVLDEVNRAEVVALEKLIKEKERRRHAEEKEREAAELADEQKRLIDVLTHEVRQPLNNASAALQSIGMELSEDEATSYHNGVARAQAVIDKVSSALSNALVAATILERRQTFKPVRCEPASLVETAVMDFPKKDRSRIQVNAEKAPLYITADPILVRIALRNLLDNALRYSPAGTLVCISVIENDAEMGVEFQVTNIEPEADVFPKDDVFARHVRGHSVEVAGSGMGLYITSEVAKLHGGWVTTKYEPSLRVFRLFLQD